MARWNRNTRRQAADIEPSFTGGKPETHWRRDRLHVPLVLGSFGAGAVAAIGLLVAPEVSANHCEHPYRSLLGTYALSADQAHGIVVDPASLRSLAPDLFSVLENNSPSGGITLVETEGLTNHSNLSRTEYEGLVAEASDVTTAIVGQAGSDTSRSDSDFIAGVPTVGASGTSQVTGDVFVRVTDVTCG